MTALAPYMVGDPFRFNADYFVKIKGSEAPFSCSRYPNPPASLYTITKSPLKTLAAYSFHERGITEE